MKLARDRMSRTWFWAASVSLALGGLLVFACSGPPGLRLGIAYGIDAGGDGRPAGSLDGGTACSDFAAAKCAKFDSCTNGVYVPVHYESVAACQAREEEACLGILAAPGNTATPFGFEQCGKDITNGNCADFFDLTNQTPACTPQKGPKPNGAACVNNGQCQSTWCYAATTAVCGVCATRPDAGAPCKATVDCGSNGMLCSVALTCAPVVPLGGSCDDSRPCAFGLSCVGATDASTKGTCQTAGTSVGTSCDDNRLKAPLCNHDDGLFCPSATDKCTESKLVDAGIQCGIFPGMKIAGVDASTPSTSVLCGGAGACEPSTESTGTCIPAAPDGQDCDTLTGPPCQAPARCVSPVDASTAGTCAILETTTCN